MATKKQKREAAEARRAAFMDKVRADGLAAQKADQEYQRKKEERMSAAAQRINQQHRSTLLNNGINPTTGLIFTDKEMVEMENKANTPERRRMLDRIKTGRAGLLDEQPPLNRSDYISEKDRQDDLSRFGTGVAYDGLKDMTVGEFREKMDGFYTGMGWNL